MKKMGIISFFALVLLLIYSCSSREEQKSIENKNETIEVKSDLVRKGVIDLVSVDANKDGMVYECPMDWNVIGDEQGDCPVCGMKLKKYSLDEAKANLDKYGYEYKK